ncbi:hypothetical protein SESBI_42706 [Sesbania bispinosa]|nr:hypothetical protein SESBI_42706 [Sesbania bispinosa]
MSSSSSSTTTPSSSGTKISPAVLFIIVVLAVLFFISGISTSDALQRQLQQLFHLHDSGLDQAFIDALPVFQFKEIVGMKEPFDCAVCLCEFSEKDKLRLGTLLTPGFSVENPIFDYDDLREDDVFPCNVENAFTTRQKTAVVEETVEKGVFPVRLGKFRKMNVEAGENGVGETSSSNLDARRCYSMGSYQYVVGNSDLRVALNHDNKGLDTRLSKGTEHDVKLSVEGDMEAKKIVMSVKVTAFYFQNLVVAEEGKIFGISNRHAILS